MKKIILLALTVISIIQGEEPSSKTDKIKKEYLKTLPYMYGWCSQEKAEAFFDLTLEVQPEVCVEIGVFAGASLLPTALALKSIGNGIVIGIDPWDKLECIRYLDPTLDEEHINWWNKTNLDYIYSTYLHTVKYWNVQTFIKTIRKTSMDAVEEIPPIDILHLDGNFGRDMPLKDLELYLPKVKSGGYIWFNDAIAKDRDPALEILLESCYVLKALNNGNCILFKKR